MGNITRLVGRGRRKINLLGKIGRVLLAHLLQEGRIRRETSWTRKRYTVEDEVTEAAKVLLPLVVS